MMYKANFAACSDIHTKHSTQSEHHVEFWKLSLAVRKETAGGWKVKGRFNVVQVCIQLTAERQENCRL